MIKHSIIEVTKVGTYDYLCATADRQEMTAAELHKVFDLDGTVEEVEAELERYETSYVALCPYNEEMCGERRLLVEPTLDRLALEHSRAMADV